MASPDARNALAADERPQRLVRLASVSLVLLIVLATMGAADQVEHANQRARYARLEQSAARAKHFLEERHETYRQILNGISSLFHADPAVTPEAFHAYVASLHLARDYPGLRRFGYVVRVPAEDLPAFVAEARHDYPEFVVHPTADVPEHFVVRHIEPLTSYRSLLGLDYASEPARRDATRVALRSDRAAITGRVPIIHDPRGGTGFLLFDRVVPPAGAAEDFRAWANVLFTPDEFFEGIASAAGAHVALRVVDRGDDHRGPLFESGTPDPSTSLVVRAPLALEGVNWAVEARPEVGFVAAAEAKEPRVLLASGLVAAMLTAALLWSVLRTRDHATALAASMTAALTRSTEELSAANAELERLATTDALTGVENRRSFDTALDEEWSRATRHGTPLSLILLDIDHFKKFNDCYGHPAGDECLRRVGAALADTARRAGERVARYGGEEFVLLLAGADRAQAEAVAEQARATIEALAIPHEGHPLGHVTISLGCASLGGETQSAADLVEAADAALYRAKAAGRNRVG